ncbi:unnamed protein product, partial [Brassica napus]
SAKISLILRLNFSLLMEKSDHDLSSHQNPLAHQLDFSVPAAAAAAAVETKMIDSSQETEKKLSQSPLEDQRDEDLPSQPSGTEEQHRLGVKSLEEPVRSWQPSATEDATTTQKPPMHRLGHPLGKCRVSKQEPLTPLGQRTEAESKDGTPNKQKHCNCKASRCLKLYCECFASGSYCNGCNCVNCQNNLENESARQEAITGTLERNPDAFKPKIAGSPHGINDLQEDVRQLLILGKHSKGCHCKKSGCLKKYCECYQANVFCSENCRCQDCKNFEGSEERSALLHGSHHVSETYIQQTTNAALSRAVSTSGFLNTPESRKRKSKDASSAVPHLVQNQAVNRVIRNGDTSLFSIPNNKAVSGSPTCTYRSSLSNTIQPRHVKDLCTLLVATSLDVANKYSDKRRKHEKDPSLDPAQRDANEINDSPDCVLDSTRMDEKPLSPATRALMCYDEHVITSEKETSAGVKTSQEKEDADTSSEIYLEKERQILSSFRDFLIQLSNRGSIKAGTNIKTNTNPSRKEPQDEEQSHRDSSLG